MRRKDRETSAARAYEILDKCQYGILSVCDGGIPYGVPVSFGREGDTIYIHTAVEGKKNEIFEKNQNVSFCCVTDTHIIEEKFTTKFASAIVTGKICEVFDEEEIRKAFNVICEKLTPSNMAGVEDEILKAKNRYKIYAIDIKEVTGKQNL